MSHTIEDQALDYLDDQNAFEGEWERNRSEAIGLFAEGRLKSYYVAHPDVAQKASKALAYSKALLAQGQSKAALVLLERPWRSDTRQYCVSVS